AGKFFIGKFSILISSLPLVLFLYFLSFIPQVASGTLVDFQYQWVPSYGINLDLRLDGLALFFTLLITGIGFLVFLYTSAYLNGSLFWFFKHVYGLYAWIGPLRQYPYVICILGIDQYQLFLLDRVQQ